jgi:chaperonin GroEL (HSP60 family)
MAISVGLHAKAKTLSSGVEVGPFRAVADALEVIPRTLIQNSGGNAMRGLTELRVSDRGVFPVFFSCSFVRSSFAPCLDI